MKKIDLHCDTISAILEKKENLKSNPGQFDLIRAIDAGVAIQFFSMFTFPTDPCIALRQTLLQVEKLYYEIEQNSDLIYLIKCIDDIHKNGDTGKLGAVIHLEGAECLGNSREILSIMYHLGLRSIGFTWNMRNLLADGIGEYPEGGGLSRAGKKFAAEMSRKGIIMDVSHLSEGSFFDVLESYDKPIMATHSNCRHICKHPRNLSDEQLRALKENGGVIGINQYTEFVHENHAGVKELIDHITYISEYIGVEHVALGSDYDGAEDMVMPGVEAYSEWPELLAERGFNHAEIQMILYSNAKRVIERVMCSERR